MRAYNRHRQTLPTPSLRPVIDFPWVYLSNRNAFAAIVSIYLFTLLFVRWRNRYDR